MNQPVPGNVSSVSRYSNQHKQNNKKMVGFVTQSLCLTEFKEHLIYKSIKFWYNWSFKDEMSYGFHWTCSICQYEVHNLAFGHWIEDISYIGHFREGNFIDRKCLIYEISYQRNIWPWKVPMPRTSLNLISVKVQVATFLIKSLPRHYIKMLGLKFIIFN